MNKTTVARMFVLIMGAAAIGYGGNGWTGALTACGAVMVGLATNRNIWKEDK